MSLRRFGVASIVVSAIVVAISFWDYYEGSGILFLPGMYIQIMLNGILLGIPTGDHYYSLPAEAFFFFSTTFYLSLVFLPFFLICLSRHKK